MTHPQLVERAVAWLRSYRCGVVLSEQACASGEIPDAIGWKRACHSVLVECKVSRGDFLSDRDRRGGRNLKQAWDVSAFTWSLRDCCECKNFPKGGGCLSFTSAK